MEEYAIMKNDERIGTLRVTRGFMTEFDANAGDDGEILRLAVYGGGEIGRLGVMQPKNGELVLRKRLSRAAMRGFPEKIEYAAPLEELAPAAQAPEIMPEPEPAADVIPEPEPEPEPKLKSAPEDGDLVWFSAPDGTLSAFDGRRMLVAIPAESAARKEAGGHVRNIEGRDYIVFAR